MKLKGISAKGKNRINEHGDDWELIKAIPFAECLKGPGLFLKSTKTGYCRWMSPDNDKDFKPVHFDNSL